MARFTKKAQKIEQETITRNLAGGEAYAQSPKAEFASILLTSFVQDQYYRTENDTIGRVVDLISKFEDKKFAAKAAIFARNRFGMRSITHIVAAEIGKMVKQATWTRPFFNKVVYRVDDMMETLAYYISKYGVKKQNKKGRTVSRGIPNAMKRGFREAFAKFDAYQLAKYRFDSKNISLIDVVRLVHPSPSEKNADALRDLVENKLKSTETWEAKISAAGQQDSATDVAEAKKEAWADLIKTRKIGYMALLKNLRNIMNQAPEVVKDACALLTDAKMIKNSKVFPFRFTTAFEEIEKFSSGDSRSVMVALDKALNLSCANVPKFEGETLIVLDVSGSMRSTYAGVPKGSSTSRSCADVGGLFAAVLAKSNMKADVLTFDGSGRYVNLNPNDSVVTNARKLANSAHGASTNFHAIFTTANKAYDRIIILSDMQGWVGYNSPATTSFIEYKRKFKCNPFIYSMDLAGYGTLQFPERKVFMLAGFSAEIFTIMQLLETDPNALVNEIEAIEI